MAKKKLTNKDMEGIIDFDELERRKKALPKKRVIAKKDEPKEPKWFEKVMTPDDFVLLTDKDKAFYVRHKQWKESVMAGPYKDRAEAEKIVDAYVKNSKKKPLKRKPIANLHSLVVEDVSGFKIL